MRKALYTLLSLFIVINLYANKSIYFDNISVKEGLSQVSVICIFQDNKGYMWFGTRDGLNRYNGYKFDTFIHSPGDSTTISDNYIRCIAQDKSGILWIGTSYGLNAYDGSTGDFKRYFIDKDKNSGNINEIVAIHIDDNGEVYAGSYRGLYTVDKSNQTLKGIDALSQRIVSISGVEGELYVGMVDDLAIYNPKSGEIVRCQPFKSITSVSGRDMINVILSDAKGNIWLSAKNKGIGLFDPKQRRLKKYIPITKSANSEPNELRDMKEDKEGNLILGTYDGVSVYNPLTDSLWRYNQGTNRKGSLSHYAVESICIDKSNGLWVGTYAGGVNYSHLQSGRFRLYNPSENGRVTGIISNMVGDKQGNIWLGTDASGVICYNIASGKFDYLPCNTAKGSTYKDNNVKSMLIKENTMYVGMYTGEVCLMDINTKRYKGIISTNEKSAIYAIEYVGDKRFLLGTYSTNGLKLLEKEKVSNFDLVTNDNHKVNINQISAMLYLDPNNIFIGTRSEGLYRYDRGELRHFSTEDDSGISGNKITTLYRTKNGTVLIGTAEGGLNIFEATKNKFTKVTTDSGLRDNKICSLIEDMDGLLWVVTRIGISQLDAKYNVSRSYGYSDGIMIEEFSPNSALVTSDNTIYVGGDNGFISFNPRMLCRNDFIPAVVVNSILINNKPISGLFDDNSTLTLNHNQANITINYSSLNYIYPQQNSYAYMLEGVDNKWLSVGNVHSVNYANLSAGRYVFRVKGSNNDGVWNEQGTSINIVIKAPLWFRWWAYLLYVVIVALAIYRIVRYYRYQQELKQQVVIRQKHEELYKARIDLFTNFSHELRTPLTLILGSVEDAINSNENMKVAGSAIKVIESNAKRMLLLVNQLMDFRKKESGKMSIQAAQNDIVAFISEVVVAFKGLAQKREITLTTHSSQESIQVWFDLYLLEKVMMNILSNAFKFTANRGEIDINIDIVSHDMLPAGCYKAENIFESAAQYLLLSVADNGIIVAKEELDKIFDPFYQVNNKRGAQWAGTGIGLSLTKGIVEMHHGAIWAESLPQQGTTIKIVLPLGNQHLCENEIAPNISDSENVEQYDFETPVVNDEPSDEPTKRRQHTILIVEDNKQLRKYIKAHLQPYYRVLEAENGEQGVQQAISQMPTLILSDIMMPVMNGLNMCHKLKDDLRTSHIPIILLTARTYALQMKEGLEFGADDYITKPFNSSILLLKIKNIINSRENLKNLYGKKLSLESMGVEIISCDDKFLQKLNEVIEKNITDPKLNIDKFCSEIGMSRASLYRKLITTTNMSPARYVQSIRLTMAAKMLNETDMTISEISDATGFSSLIHFSATFRKQFGVPPSRYKVRGALQNDSSTLKKE